MTDDILIIGAGPAGMTAALYAGRAKLRTRVLEKETCGGQVLLTESVENFPGVVRMEAFAWVEAQKQQLALLSDVTVTQDACVKRIEMKPSLFHIHVTSGSNAKSEIFEARAVIVATGAYPKRLGIPGENELTGRGVSYCATCDGPLYRGKDVVVIGGGDSALEEALYLAKLAKSVTLVHRRDAFRAAAILQERVRASSVMTLALDAVPVGILGASRVEGVRIRSVKDARESVIPCDGVFIFVGFAAETDFIKSQLTMSPDGRIVTDEFMMTSNEGIFACGDCCQRPLYQIVTACADGAIAAHSAGKYLERATL